MATSSKVKRKYNTKTYKSWQVQIKPELYNTVQAYMERNNISRREFLEKAIEILEK